MTSTTAPLTTNRSDLGHGVWVERFNLLNRNGVLETCYERSPDLGMQLRRGGAITSDNVAGGAVAVLLDLDGEGICRVIVEPVRLDDDGQDAGAAVIELAIDELVRIRDALRRLR